MNIFFILAILCAVATLGTLFVGVGSMGKGGDDGRRKSNKMMQMRVGFQVATIVFLLLAVAGN